MMKFRFTRQMSKPAWLITEDGWNKAKQKMYETLFAQGNGYLGLRGVLAEKPYEATPGTFIAGLYDKATAQETELVNLPNPIHFKITAKGEKLGPAAMDVSKYKRYLDMQQGLLFRHTTFLDSRKNRFDYQSVQFVSMCDKYLIGMRIYLTPLDKDTEITVQSDIDVSITNSGVLTEGRKQHFGLAQVFQTEDRDFLIVRTLEKGISVAYATTLAYQIGGRTVSTSDHAFNLKLKKNETVCFTKLICVLSSDELYPGAVDRRIGDVLDESVRRGFDLSLKRHVNAMKKLWRSSDISIVGDPDVQKALRFNIYHMLICGPVEGGRASIGAKTLSGEGYRGHIFWDADVFSQPFYVYTQPSVARNMLLYRYYRLDAARKIAKANGYKGAQFPWESADTGEECTPAWAKNFDGKIIQVRTGELEHHIVSDVAYAVYRYYMATGDEAFMLRYGYELMFETAKFAASRVSLNRKTGFYGIRRVIGPDEFHEGINNNAYTNMMAKWNLLTAHHIFKDLRRTKPAYFRMLSDKIYLNPKECAEWKKIAARIAMNVRDDGIIEQFDGFFKRKKVRVSAVDENGLPTLPVGLDLSKVNKTQYLKQADVVMLLYLLSGYFSHKTKKKNYFYYLSRTLHKSSLSAAVHAILGNEVGDKDKAYQLFSVSARADLENVYGNVESGMHAASLGGTWQAFIHGFAGIRMVKEKLSIRPRLPEKWKKISFVLKWHGLSLFFDIHKLKICVRFRSPNKNARVPVFIVDKFLELKPNRLYSFKYVTSPPKRRGR